jgi:hypothetical protein
MALYLKHVQTVLSLKQLADSDVQAEPDVQLEADAPVASIAGTRVPKYLYHTKASPKMPRLGSVSNLLQVPDVDDR